MMKLQRHLFPMTLALALALSAVPPALAQAKAAQPAISEVPPVTMGLWQTETTSKVTGLENTPMAGMAGMMGREHSTQSCLTPDQWKRDIQGFNARQQHGCTLSNVHQDAHEVSFDEVCQTARGGTSTAHADILIDDQQHAHGTVLMKVTDENLPQPMNIDVTMNSHYVGSNCGDVKPDSAKMLK